MTTAFDSLTLWLKDSQTFSSKTIPGINDRTQDLQPADKYTLKSGEEWRGKG